MLLAAHLPTILSTVFSLPTTHDLPYVVGASLIGIALIAAAIVQLQRDRTTRSPDELRNRRRNYFPLAMVLGIAVFLIPDVVDETVPSHHIDEFIDTPSAQSPWSGCSGRDYAFTAPRSGP